MATTLREIFDACTKAHQLGFNDAVKECALVAIESNDVGEARRRILALLKESPAVETALRKARRVKPQETRPPR